MKELIEIIKLQEEALKRSKDLLESMRPVKRHSAEILAEIRARSLAKQLENLPDGEVL